MVGYWHGARCRLPYMAQLMPLPLTVSCFSKSRLVLPSWYRLTWVVQEKGSLNGCVSVCVCVGTSSLYSLDLDEAAPLSEVLRLHLLSSGARRLPSQARSDLQHRGGYSSHDDPALEFCQHEAAILQMLRQSSVFQLTPGTER